MIIETSTTEARRESKTLTRGMPINKDLKKALEVCFTHIFNFLRASVSPW